MIKHTFILFGLWCAFSVSAQQATEARQQRKQMEDQREKTVRAVLEAILTNDQDRYLELLGEEQDLEKIIGKIRMPGKSQQETEAFRKKLRDNRAAAMEKKRVEAKEAFEKSAQEAEQGGLSGDDRFVWTRPDYSRATGPTTASQSGIVKVGDRYYIIRVDLIYTGEKWLLNDPAPLKQVPQEDQEQTRRLYESRKKSGNYRKVNIKVDEDF